MHASYLFTSHHNVIIISYSRFKLKCCTRSYTFTCALTVSVISSSLISAA
jgi:hypothetical protein